MQGCSWLEAHSLRGVLDVKQYYHSFWSWRDVSLKGSRDRIIVEKCMTIS